MYDYERVYTNYGIYNCQSGACIANNSICIDVISIISKSRKEDENNNVFIRGQPISIVYNCKRESSIASINKRKRESNNKIIDVYAKTYTSYKVYNCKRGATTIHPRRRQK